MDEKRKIFLVSSIIGCVFIIIAFIAGYYQGYTDPQLNIENGILFCKSHNEKMCHQNSTEIACGSRCSINDDLTIYRNPELTIKDFRFGIREDV